MPQLSMRVKVLLAVLVAAVVVCAGLSVWFAFRPAGTSPSAYQAQQYGDWRQEWVDRGIPEEEWPVVLPNEYWRVVSITRLTACDNRPGYNRFYVWTLNAEGSYMGAVAISFESEPSEGIAYDHPNIWGVTGSSVGNAGYLWWDHYGKPTRYRIWVDRMSLVDNIRTDLGNEYCRPGGPEQLGGWRPVNRPGVYSYRITLQYLEAP